MRILVLLSVLGLLASCTMGLKQPTTPTTTASGEVKTTPVVPVSDGTVADAKLVTLNYTLREGAADGKILETTLQSVAQSNGTFSTGGRYEPFQVMINQASPTVIIGFQNGLLGMKKGEKKMIEVSPAEGYGATATPQTVKKYEIAPVFTMMQDKKLLADRVTQTVEKKDLKPEMQTAKVGQVFTGANNATAKVTSATDTTITLEIENVDSPFYGKKISVGTTAENQSATFKVLDMSGTGVKMEITNKESPFYNKNFAVGESFIARDGSKVTINAIGEDTIDIAQAHPLMGKTLYFDVEIIDIQ